MYNLSQYCKCLYNTEKFKDYMDYHFKQVMKFNTLCGNDNKSVEGLLPLYASLCKEEVKETLAAYNGCNVKGEPLTERQSLRELVDGCCDIFYVAGYYYYLLKGHAPDFNCKSKLEDNISSNIDMIELLSSKGEYAGLLNYAIKILNILDVNREDAFEEVHKSNLSKFIDITGIPKDDILEIALLESADIKNIYKEKGNELPCVVYETINYEDETYLVFRNKDGKVLKPSSFVEPNLDKVIDHLFN